MNPLDMMMHVQQQGDLGRQRGEQTRLGMLSGQAMTAGADQQPGILSAMAKLNPEMAQGQQDRFQSQDDRAKTKAAAAAQYVLNAQKTGDANAVRGAYQTVVPFLTELGKAQGKVPPPEWSDDMLPMLHQIVSAGGGAGAGQEMKNVRVGEDGYYWAVQNGQMVNTGVKAAPQNQIIDTGNGFYGVNKGNLQAAPVQVGGAPPQAAPQAPQAGMYQTPQGVVRLGDDLSPEQREAAMADVAAGGQGGPVQLPPRAATAQQAGGGDMLRKASAAITPYQQAQLDMQRERTTAATAAKEEAAAARKVAEDLKTSAKQQESQARQDASAEAANALVMSIDQLTSHPGFAELGTAWGDTKIATPLIRNDAKDADAKLKNVAGQVALATLARLKSLSSTGATGFGSLTKPELDLVQNSIATLQSENISNAELTSSLKVIRDAMEKTANWKPQASAAPASSAAPAASGGWSIQRVD